MNFIRDYLSSGEEELQCNSNENIDCTNLNNIKITKKQYQKRLSESKKRDKFCKIKSECKCEKKCAEIICKEHQKLIHQTYWDKNFVQRKYFIRQYVHFSKIKRRRNTTNVNSCRKNEIFMYNLPNEEGILTKVCQKFFLNTLGYNYSSR